MHFINVPVTANDPWVDKQIKELDISRHSIVVLVKRKNKAIIPYETMILKEWDRLFVYTDKYLMEATDIEI